MPIGGKNHQEPTRDLKVIKVNMIRWSWVSFIVGCLVGSAGISFLISILQKLLEI